MGRMVLRAPGWWPPPGLRGTIPIVCCGGSWGWRPLGPAGPSLSPSPPGLGWGCHLQLLPPAGSFLPSPRIPLGSDLGTGRQRVPAQCPAPGSCSCWSLAVATTLDAGWPPRRGSCGALPPPGELLALVYVPGVIKIPGTNSWPAQRACLRDGVGAACALPGVLGWGMWGVPPPPHPLLLGMLQHQLQLGCTCPLLPQVGQITTI